MSQINYSRYKYIPDEIEEKTFLEKFVVRTEIFDDIFEDIKSADYDVSNQHYILVGQRGQGKTSLLRKIQLEVQNDKKLSKFLLPIKFSEEQYQIRTLCRLWEVVAEYLENIYEEEFEGLLDVMEKHLEENDYALRCFSYLEDKIKLQNKKLILLIDNIDELFGKLKEKEQRQLREILLSSSSFRIIGGSTKMLEQHHDYAKPFYEFFKIIKLKGLNYSDSVKFLKTIAKDEEKEKINNIIKNTPQRVETIRQLTGGVPRTLVMLYDIFIDDESNSFEDLLKILNDATPLYKERMDNLPRTLQDIVHNIAMNWDGVTTKELAKKTRLSSANVSSQLKQLEKYQIIEFESTGKNKIYKIHERFFNIWYLIRFGRKKDRNKVEWLVKFLTAWYSGKELEERASRFIDSIKNKKLNESYAYHMCEALSYSGLDIKTEYEMKQNISKYLTDVNSNLKNELSKTDVELLNQVTELEKKNKIKEAIKLLQKSKKSSNTILGVLGYLYEREKDYKKAEEYYLRAVKGGNTVIFGYLGGLYFRQKEYEKAEEYYLKAVETGDTNVFHSMGVVSTKIKDYKKAEEYYLKAVDIGDNNSLKNLCILYTEQKEYEKAEKYFLKAIEKKIDGAFLNFGNLYADQKKYKKAKEHYLKAIENGDNGALRNMGILYKENKEYERAEEYYLKAIESEDNNALLTLGILYAEQKKYEKAEEYYLKAIESGDNNALLSLGDLYAEQKDYKKVEEYYLKAIESGDDNALNSLSWYYFEESKNLSDSLKLVKKSYVNVKHYHNTHTLSIIYLWAEEFKNSYEKFIEWLDYDEALDSENDVIVYLNLLIAKGQYFKAKEFFEIEKYQFKDRYKPIWYALMTLMQDEFPNEIKKMGSELTQSVGEILEEIERLRKKYE
ncbi:MAG: tetratricopeptide (TPR) repeat protein [Sulfurimonas sp.]|jgi:tetratricopeptide (TPR) repeat protein|uniref:tetratricopeptide repeat protein n=1 Tax=Sulfurimonas sp. TaxID=2022749 RepID=UPI0039E43FCB